MLPKGYDLFLTGIGFFLLGWAVDQAVNGAPIVPIAILAAVGVSLVIGGVLLSGAHIIADALKK